MWYYYVPWHWSSRQHWPSTACSFWTHAWSSNIVRRLRYWSRIAFSDHLHNRIGQVPYWFKMEKKMKKKEKKIRLFLVITDMLLLVATAHDIIFNILKWNFQGFFGEFSRSHQTMVAFQVCETSLAPYIRVICKVRKTQHLHYCYIYFHSS